MTRINYKNEWDEMYEGCTKLRRVEACRRGFHPAVNSEWL